MTEKQPKNGFSQFLEKLQEESWQLELLISGFAIFLVAGSREPLFDFLTKISVLASGTSDMPYLGVLVAIMVGSWMILLVNLILHVILRGLWISAIGLRYVSGDINFEKLRLSAKFDKHLRSRISGFDTYIENLEKLSSVVFAFTFLILFMILSLGSFSIFILALARLMNIVIEPNVSASIYTSIKIVFTTFFSILGLLYFIDFVTLGWVKKRRGFSVVYFPIYRLLSWVTLAFLYRPLYYNLIDNKFGRRIGFLLVPYLILVILVTSIEIDSFLYFPKLNDSSTLKDDHYQSHFDEDNRRREVLIQGKFVEDNYLEMFIPYKSRDDLFIEHLCPDLRPDKSIGVKTTAFQFTPSLKNFTNPDSVLLCFGLGSRIFVNDSLHSDVEYYFYQQAKYGEVGINTVLDISYLDQGKHHIKVEKQRKRKEDLKWEIEADFPFWKVE